MNFNNPIIHGVVSIMVFGLGWFLSSGNAVLTLTIGGVLKAFYSYLVQNA